MCGRKASQRLRPLSHAPTLDQVFTLAQRLSAADKLRLIARLAPELAAALPADAADDSWYELLRFGDEAAARRG